MSIQASRPLFYTLLHILLDKLFDGFHMVLFKLL